MRKKSELSDLTDNPSQIFMIILSAVFLSFFILISAKFYQNRNTTTDKQVITLTIKSDSFPTLQLGHYALWNITPSGQYQFLKRFNSVEKQLVSLNKENLTTLDIDTNTEITEFVVTIEKEGDRDEVPNNFELIRGPFIKNKAYLEFNIETPVQSSSFVLATPSDGNLTINELSGIWFVDNKLENGSLGLSEINKPNFTYQAMISNTQTNEILMIGRFSDPKSSDDFQKYSLNSKVFNYPGEDFLRNLPEGLEPPLNLSNGNYRVIISLEPFISGSDFTGEEVFLELFNNNISTNLSPHTSQTLDYTFKPIVLSIEKND